jgi:hypothetical protein
MPQSSPVPSLWEIVAATSAIVAILNVLFLWAVRWLLAHQERLHAARFDAFASTVEQRLEDVPKLERQLLELRAELPRDYVRREDQIRRDSVLEAKIDALRETFTRFLERTKNDRP